MQVEGIFAVMTLQITLCKENVEEAARETYGPGYLVSNHFISLNQ